MNLIALNGDKLSKYSLAPKMKFKKENWHGHQVGIAIGVVHKAKRNVILNYLGNNGTAEDLKRILDDTSIIKIEKEVTLYDECGSYEAIIWYVPYAVQDHSAFRESLNFTNITVGMKNHVETEVLLSIAGVNRYFIAKYETTDKSVYDMINNMQIFDSLGLDKVTNFQLDFYNEAGEQTMIEFADLDALRQCITSVRLLEVDTEVENGFEEN